MCACSDTELTVNTAPGYVARDLRVSVLGVFDNGRMNQAAWDDWSPMIAAALHGTRCDPGFSDAMEKDAPAVFSDVDQSTRNDGITDELFDRLGANARGNSILVVEVFGHPKQKKTDSTPTVAPDYSGQTQRGGGRGRRGRGEPESVEPPASTETNYEVSIGVYSPSVHEVVASVVLSNESPSSDTLNEFAAKLRATLAGATCAGWKWQSGG
jgi:hypothetical protein